MGDICIAPGGWSPISPRRPPPHTPYSLLWDWKGPLRLLLLGLESDGLREPSRCSPAPLPTCICPPLSGIPVSGSARVGAGRARRPRPQPAPGPGCESAARERLAMLEVLESKRLQLAPRLPRVPGADSAGRPRSPAEPVISSSL